MISITGRSGGSGTRGMSAAVAALALTVLTATRAYAGVEFVTPTTNCTNKLVTAGGTLPVIAGPNVQFEVWGNSVDLTNTTNGLTVTGPAGITAKIIAEHSGAFNQGRGCGFTGSAVVSVSTPGTLTSDAGATLSFRMPLGDLSSQSMTIKALPTISTTWTTNGTLQPSNLPCIVKTGSITAQNQDETLVIQLPAGHDQDQSTCTSNVINVVIKPSSIGSLFLQGSAFRYTVSGLPSFLTASQATPQLPTVPGTIALTFNVAGIRGITAPSTSTITFTNPNASNRKVSLSLQVIPNLGQGFAQVASANPASSVVGNPIDFTLTLSAPAPSSTVAFKPSLTQPVSTALVITWRMTTASCFVQAISTAPYDATQPFQHFVFPGGQTSAIIRVRSVNNGGCTDKLHPVQHIFEAWIGDNRVNPQVTAVTSGPTYTKTTISLLF